MEQTRNLFFFPHSNNLSCFCIHLNFITAIILFRTILLSLKCRRSIITPVVFYRDCSQRLCLEKNIGSFWFRIFSDFDLKKKEAFIVESFLSLEYKIVTHGTWHVKNWMIFSHWCEITDKFDEVAGKIGMPHNIYLLRRKCTCCASSLTSAERYASHNQSW